MICSGGVSYGSISARYDNVLHVIVVSYSGLSTCIIIMSRWCTYLMFAAMAMPCRRNSYLISCVIFNGCQLRFSTNKMFVL